MLDWIDIWESWPTPLHIWLLCSSIIPELFLLCGRVHASFSSRTSLLSSNNKLWCTVYILLITSINFLKWFELQEPTCRISTKANRCHLWPFCELTIVPFLTHVLIDADHFKPAPELKLWRRNSFPVSNSSTALNVHLLLYFTGAMMKTCILPVCRRYLNTVALLFSSGHYLHYTVKSTFFNGPFCSASSNTWERLYLCSITTQ